VHPQSNDDVDVGREFLEARGGHRGPLPMPGFGYSFAIYGDIAGEARGYAFWSAVCAVAVRARRYVLIENAFGKLIAKSSLGR
jgi:hypothetical protein